jgi:dolichol-phosphate mannosyltransferase
MPGPVEISVVVPVYGCRECVSALHERVVAALESAGTSFELILVDDRSPDGAWDEIRALAERDPRVRGIRLSRNFGQHLAITAGLAESLGQWTVVMDCDLQEPPELIPRLHAKAQEGFDIVFTARSRRGEPGFRRLTSRAYLTLRNFMLDTDVRTDHGTMSILSRRAVDGFLSVGDRDREYTLILYWLGFESTTVEFERAERHAGESSYTFRSLMRLGLDGLFFQTTVLLRYVVYLGFLVALAGAALATYYVVVYLTADRIPSGFTSIAVLLLLLVGFLITSLGIVGLYVGRIFEQGKRRPLYVVESRVGAVADDPAGAVRPTVGQKR